MTGLDDDESSRQLFALFSHKLIDGLNQCRTRIAGKAYQDDTSRVRVADEDEPAKVFVFCQRIRPPVYAACIRSSSTDRC